MWDFDWDMIVVWCCAIVPVSIALAICWRVDHKNEKKRAQERQKLADEAKENCQKRTKAMGEFRQRTQNARRLLIGPTWLDHGGKEEFLQEVCIGGKISLLNYQPLRISREDFLRLFPNGIPSWRSEVFGKSITIEDPQTFLPELKLNGSEIAYLREATVVFPETPEAPSDTYVIRFPELYSGEQ